MKLVTTLTNLLGATNPKRYIKSALWIVATRFISIGVSLASTFYVARTLGPQNFGELNYAVSLVNMLMFFAAIASNTVISRDLIKNSDQQKNILGTAWIVTSTGLLVSIISIAATLFILPHDQITILLVGILCAAQLFTTLQVTQNFFFANTNTKYISITQLCVHITVSIAKIIAMTQGQGVLVLASIMFIEQLLSACIVTTLYIKHTHISPFQWHWDRGYAKKLVVDSIPFVFITMSIVVAGRIDQVFLKHFIDTTTVGMYSVAVQLTEIWQVVPQMLLVALFPALVNAHTSETAYGKRILALAALLGFYSVVASAATTLLAPYIIPLIYGDAFIPSIPLLQIYTWSLLGTVGGFLVTNILVTENQRRIQIMVGFIPMVINIILNILWIPTYGAPGAAWATVVSYSLAPLIPFFYSSIRRKLFVAKTA